MGLCRHGEDAEKCGSCITERADIEAFTNGFERVDFYRLASAFDVSINKVHEAVGQTGTLYRMRA